MSPDELKAIRHSLGLSAEKFARLARVASGRTVRRWEGGEQNIPGPVTLIAELLRDDASPRRELHKEKAEAGASALSGGDAPLANSRQDDTGG